MLYNRGVHKTGASRMLWTN